MGYQFFHIETYARVAKSYEREITIKKGSRAGQKEIKKTETRSLKKSWRNKLESMKLPSM